MVRAIAKQIEGAIALVIYILFLLFYISSLNITISNQLNSYKTSVEFGYLLESLLNSLTKTYYVVTMEVSIPKATKEYFCSLSDSQIKRDFCERFPIYFPMDLYSFTSYNGSINGTRNSTSTATTNA